MFYKLTKSYYAAAVDQSRPVMVSADNCAGPFDAGSRLPEGVIAGEVIMRLLAGQPKTGDPTVRAEGGELIQFGLEYLNFSPAEIERAHLIVKIMQRGTKTEAKK